MNLTPIKANMTELRLNAMVLLFSYQTPVAVMMTTADGLSVFYQTEKKWSKTTSRHIKVWLALYGDPGAAYKPQDFFDSLVKGA